MHTLAASWDVQTTMLLGLGILVVGYVMLRASRQRLDRLRSTSPGDRLASARRADSVRDQLDGLMVQLEELARLTTAQIETRYAKLDALLAEADRKIARLEELLAAIEPQAQGRGQAGQPAAGAAAGPAVKPEHRRVHELADAGKTPVQIAQEVGRDVGEVELILALRKKG